MSGRAIVAVVALLILVATACGDEQQKLCSTQPLEEPTSSFFVDVSDTSGIRDQNFVAEPTVSIPINDHSRLGFADIDGDGFDDIVMHSLYPNAEAGVGFEHLVFRNRGDGTFDNVSDRSGLRNIQAGFFAFADVDNDGDQDVFAGLDVPLAGHSHMLLLNDGTGVFTPRADSGLEGAEGNTVAGNGVFADFNNDGKVDLYLGNGHTRYVASDQLFFGNGDGTFTDETSRLTQNVGHPSNGTVACDYDNDGDLDVFVSVYGVSNGGGQNVLWENDGAGNFTNVAMERGFSSQSGGNYYLASVGFGVDAEPNAAPGSYIGSNGFGIQCEDVNHDGYMDVFLTAISHPDESHSRRWSDPTGLFINAGPAAGFAFKNEFLQRGLPFNEGDVDGAMIDFDNDGFVDLSVSRDRKYESRYDNDEQKAWFALFRQKPDGTFDSMGVASGINDDDGAMLRMKGAQNHAWADIDRDGDLDLLVGGRDQGGGRPNFLFENRIGSLNTWLALRLVGDGVAVNRDAIGARVEVRYADRVLVREIKSSRGMHSSLDTRTVHIGLGEMGCEFSLRIVWPDGTIDEYDAADVPTSQYLLATYGARGLTAD